MAEKITIKRRSGEVLLTGETAGEMTAARLQLLLRRRGRGRLVVEGPPAKVEPAEVEPVAQSPKEKSKAKKN